MSAAVSLPTEPLRDLLEAIRSMRAAGYTRDDVQELVVSAIEHIQDNDHQPYALGRCINCGRVIIGWTAYHWSIVVREPCPRCGQPW